MNKWIKAEKYEEAKESVLKLTEMKEPIPFYSHHIYLSPPYTDFPHANDSGIITIENSVHFCHCNLFDIFD